MTRPSAGGALLVTPARPDLKPPEVHLYVVRLLPALTETSVRSHNMYHKIGLCNDQQHDGTPIFAHDSRVSSACGLHSSRQRNMLDVSGLISIAAALPAPVEAVAGRQVVAQLRQHLRSGRAQLRHGELSMDDTHVRLDTSSDHATSSPPLQQDSSKLKRHPTLPQPRHFVHGCPEIPVRQLPHGCLVGQACFGFNHFVLIEKSPEHVHA